MRSQLQLIHSYLTQLLAVMNTLPASLVVMYSRNATNELLNKLSKMPQPQDDRWPSILEGVQVVPDLLWSERTLLMHDQLPDEGPNARTLLTTFLISVGTIIKEMDSHN